MATTLVEGNKVFKKSTFVISWKDAAILSKREFIVISSLLRRAVFEPLYCLKNNSPRISYWKQLEKTQYLSLQELQEIQWRRLQKLYAFLWENNKFYRSRFQSVGLEPDSLTEPADIKKIPILTKAEIRENCESMISDGFEQKSLLHFKTGGSTGKALDIYITEECSELRNACARRADRWTGWEPGETVGAAWGNPQLPVTLKEKIFHNLFQPYIYLDTMAVSSDSVLDFARNWERVKPTLLYGHAHSIFILAQYVQELGCRQIKPTGILSTSMMLFPHERKLIEQVFSCKVTDRYGCEEVSLIGCECEKHDGMHMNIEHLVIEFIKDDGTTAQTGETGNIVVTDLMNYAMPFIRYKVEDVGVPMDTMCPCGRGLPLMGRVTGRVADFLMSKNGDRVAGISLIENTLTEMAGIDQMQIVQNSIDDMILNVVPGKSFNEQVQLKLVQYFRKVFPDTTVTVNKVEKILPEPSGKFRFSICRIADVN
ncbi:MAG: phenylacetate-CoA ligase [Desulforhopalus sp.]